MALYDVYLPHKNKNDVFCLTIDFATKSKEIPMKSPNKSAMKKTLTFRVPDELLKSLEKHAEKNQRATSTMARIIVREYLQSLVEGKK